ncbi:unnamed protein product [Schistosoma curassoni]|uniref:Uncharacterized protein n=1 Tax=Schistosoma curassoni TaxID=6186 RepID=A0A183KY31_9TREM|nr:unnamed protein product [Schistosoma curassoni]
MVTDNKSYWLKVPAKLPAEHLGDTLLNAAVGVGAGTAYDLSCSFSVQSLKNIKVICMKLEIINHWKSQFSTEIIKFTWYGLLESSY